MFYCCLFLGCTWYDNDTAKSQQAKPAPSHQQRWFGTERCLCLCIPRLHRLTECRQSHSRVRPPTSVVATEVSHCVFACLPSRFRSQVFPFLDTSQNQRERAVYFRTLALVRQTKLLSVSIAYKTKYFMSNFYAFV